MYLRAVRKSQEIILTHVEKSRIFIICAKDFFGAQQATLHIVNRCQRKQTTFLFAYKLLIKSSINITGIQFLIFIVSVGVSSMVCNTGW